MSNLYCNCYCITEISTRQYRVLIVHKYFISHTKAPRRLFPPGRLGQVPAKKPAGLWFVVVADALAASGAVVPFVAGTLEIPQDAELPQPGQRQCPPGSPPSRQRVPIRWHRPPPGAHRSRKLYIFTQSLGTRMRGPPFDVTRAFGYL